MLVAFPKERERKWLFRGGHKYYCHCKWRWL